MITHRLKQEKTYSLPILKIVEEPNGQNTDVSVSKLQKTKTIKYLLNKN